MDKSIPNLKQNENEKYTQRNFWSKLTFSWLYRVFFKGIQQPLDHTDLVPIEVQESSEELTDLMERYWDEEVSQAKQKNRKASYRNAVLKLYWWPYLKGSFYAFLEECVFKTLAPVFLGILVNYFNNDVPNEIGYIAVFAIIVCNFGVFMCHHPYFYGAGLIGMKIRIASSGLIYRKALRLSTFSLKKTTVGQMVNLLSNDVKSFDLAIYFISFIYIGPMQCMITAVLLWLEIGPSCIAGLVLIVFYVPFQVYMGKIFSKYRLKIAERTDNRVRIMNEIISGIRVIKMYAWEAPFKAIVEKARRLEVDTILSSSYLRAFNLTLFWTATKVVVFLSLLIFVLNGNLLTAKKVFVTISLFNNIRLTMTLFFYFAVSYGSECLTSFRRIQNFLEMEEKEENTNLSMCKLRPKSRDVSLEAKNVFGRWNPQVAHDNLNNISFRLKAGQLMTLIGSVGSGKSSLIHAILGELPIRDGSSIQVNGRISYASQETWIFSGTIRQNILFGRPYFAKRYKDVVRVCALEKDFELFPKGDLALVGERGCALSGGQKARINLARAVYHEADIYLLDDPLSAVDAHVGKHLFESCISDYLKSKIVILATHQQQFIKTAHQVLVMRNGYVEAQGTYNEIKCQGFDFSLLDEGEEEAGLEPTQEISEPVNNHLLTTVTKLRRASETWSLLHGSTGEPGDIGMDLLAPTGYDGSHLSLTRDELYGEPDENEEGTAMETKQTGSIGLKLYCKYFGLGGGCFTLLFLTVNMFLSQAAFVASDYWLALWTNSEKLKGEYVTVNGSSLDVEVFTLSDDRIYYFFWYAIITVILIVSALLRSVLFFKVSLASSRNLHNKMFASIIRVGMKFYEVHPIGQILNRFTKDTGQVDDLLPQSMFDFLTIMIGTLSVIFTIIGMNIWMVIPTGLLTFFFVFVRRTYLPAARDIKRLEGITRSPVFSHLSSTFQGLTTIRAFNNEHNCSNQFDQHQDQHTSSWVLYLASTRLFGIYLDLLSTLFVSSVSISVLFQDGLLGGDVGLAISMAMLLSGALQWGVRQSAEVESFMTSVERILEYAKLKPEMELEPTHNQEINELKENGWPKRGKISFQDVFLYYDENEAPVLKNLTFSVNAGEKIGIVGRTGAGKSSLISCLFRLTQPEGEITIDDIQCSRLPLDFLRRTLSIIPQDPTLFSGSLRYNMDPFSEYTDDQLWDALEEIQLKEFVKTLGKGLLSEISEGGGNLSVGQRQLVCLARALLKHNKILVMDEATANVDPHTDSLIQETIRSKFVDCTVLTIAHRLHTIMDCDRIIVMDSGKLMEFDSPHLLLQNPSSIFLSLVNQVGPFGAIQLKDIAKEAFFKKNGFNENSQPPKIIVEKDEELENECTKL